ncbi:MAG: flavodoxin family protein, partial [Chlorobi bacterium]|nr:flavodoxin family protein [Chlorobiota bacterium]
MKIIAVNSSQQKDSGPTDKILQPFLEGMRQAGAEVELFYTEDLDIRACRNCEGIMNTHDIDTCRNDDMKKLFPKFKESDVWVFATPNCTNNSSHG